MLPKIRRHLRNKSRSIFKLSKNVFYKKCGPKLIFFNEKKDLIFFVKMKLVSTVWVSTSLSKFGWWESSLAHKTDVIPIRGCVLH